MNNNHSPVSTTSLNDRPPRRPPHDPSRPQGGTGHHDLTQYYKSNCTLLGPLNSWARGGCPARPPSGPGRAFCVDLTRTSQNGKYLGVRRGDTEVACDIHAPPGKIPLNGPCGLGKGTKSTVIKDEYCLCHLTTGDMLRAAVSVRTSLGVKAKEAMDMASNTDSITMKSPKFTEAANINEEEGPHKVATFPDHLILDHILPRLPVKSLLRFKSVCWNWRSTIATHEFAKSHMAFSGSRQQFLLLLEDDALVENPNYRIFRAGFKYGDSDRRLKIAGCCNGLVGFGSRVSDTVIIFFVLNPATGQRVEILAPDDEDFINCSPFGYWFGYVSSVDDYKMAAFSPCDGAFWIFSWKSGIWKRISCSLEKYGGIRAMPGPPALVDDSLYWPINLFNLSWNVGTDIVELNLVSEEYEVKPRKNFAFGDRGVDLVNWKGCLALHTTSDYYDILDVWMLRQNGDWNSWEKVFSKILKDVNLLYFSTTGKLLVSHLNQQQSRWQLKVVDDLSQLGMEEDSHGQGIILSSSLSVTRGVGDYFESLISPF